MTKFTLYDLLQVVIGKERRKWFGKKSVYVYPYSFLSKITLQVNPYFFLRSFVPLLAICSKYIDNIKINDLFVRNNFWCIKFSFKYKNYKVAIRGVDKSLEIAMSKSLGEMVERYSGQIDTQAKKIVTSIDNLIAQKIPYYAPHERHKFLTSLISLEKSLQIKSDTELDWIAVKNITTNSEVLVPRNLIEWNYYNHHATNAKNSCQPTSNGSAGYFDKEAAILSGLCEVIERDSFLNYWLTKSVPKIIEKKSITTTSLADIEELEKTVSLYLFDITSDILVPTVMILLLDESKKTAIVNAACDKDIDIAIHKALAEATGCFNNLYFTNSETEGVASDFDPLLLTANQRMVYYRKERYEYIKWLIGKDFITTKEIRAKCETDTLSFDQLINKISSLGYSYEPLCYEYKNDLLDELTFNVVKVIIPECLPLYLKECYMPGNSDRLQHFYKWKHGKDFDYTKLHKYPHPFP